MRRRVKGIICLIAALGLVACSANSPAVPEWKSVYLQLVMDAIVGTRDMPGVSANYAIELYDMNMDGIPELQECVMGHNNEYSIWFIDDGRAKQIVGSIPFEPEWKDMTTFVSLFRHNETGEVIAVHLAGSAFFTDHYCFNSTNNDGIWKLDSVWGITIPEEKYTYTTSDGTESVISKREYEAWEDSILNEHTRLAGEYLPLAKYFKHYEETAEAFSVKLEKAPQIISDFFDSYDGIPSRVYKEYELPAITK